MSHTRAHCTNAAIRLAAIATLVLAVGAAIAAPAAAQPTITAPQVIAGPNAGVISLGGLAIARDGSGGLVYLASVDGVAHVFVSRLVAGVFQAPEQIDSSLASASSQPVITGTNGGALIVAFINDANLYVAAATSSTSAFSTPVALATDASSPSLQMNLYGEAYLAFTVGLPAGNDVDVEYFNTQSWAPASPVAMNATPDNAGTGAGRPEVATAGDGVALVTWGENGHIYSRRVWGTMTSTETEQLDPSSVVGVSESSADSPSASVGGDSSYPDIAFREQLAGSGESRVLLARLIAETTDPAVIVDGVTASDPGGAYDPDVAMNEYGRGFVTVETYDTNHVMATPLGTNGVPGSPKQIDTGTDLAAPHPVTAPAGLISTLIAWQETPVPGGAEILVRYAQDGVDLAATETASLPTQGPADAAAGLAAGGDGNGDAALAWVQGSPGALTIDADQLYQPPGAPTVGSGGSSTTTYTNNPKPQLSWSEPKEDWGPLTYTLTLDGKLLGETSTSTMALTAPLIDGPHTWQVQATNPAGLSSSLRATLFVDTEAPRLRIRLTGQPRVGQPVAVLLAYVDPPNPSEPGSQASGISTVTVSWGRRGPVGNATGRKLLLHTYTRSGLYRLTVTATDRAGNATTITRYLRILPAMPTAGAVG